MSWILVQTQRVRITWRRAADLLDDLFIPIFIQIREGDAVALVPFACSRRSRDVDERRAPAISQQHIRQQ